MSEMIKSKRELYQKDKEIIAVQKLKQLCLSGCCILSDRDRQESDN